MGARAVVEIRNVFCLALRLSPPHSVVMTTWRISEMIIDDLTPCLPLDYCVSNAQSYILLLSRAQHPSSGSEVKLAK